MKKLNQIQNELQEQKELTTTLEAQLLTAHEEINNLTIKINHFPTWENLNEVEIERDKVKKEYYELKEKLEQVVREKQVLEVQFKDLSSNRLTSKEVKQENQRLNREISQVKIQVKELEEKVEELESELLTEQLSSRMVLESEREKKEEVKVELEQQQNE